MADLTVTQGAISQSAGISNFAAGSFSTGAGDAIAVEQVCGFKPRYVRIIDETNATVYEKTEGMTAAKTVKVLPGTTGASDTVTQSVESGTLIAFGDRGFTVAAGLAVASSSFSWIAIG